MGKAYSLDLRERVWSLYLEGERSQAEVAEHFNVSASFVRDLARRARENQGCVAARPHGGGRRLKADTAAQKRVTALVVRTPDATLAEHCARLAKSRGAPTLSVPTMHRLLARLGLTRKKKGSARQ